MDDWKSKADWKDRNWKYTAAAKTDISRTIARVRREMKEAAEIAEQKAKTEAKKVMQIRKVSGK